MIQTAFGSECDYDPSVIPPPGDRPTPVWELATMYPPQGAWTEAEYLSLTEETNRLIEYTDGVLEFLPAPTFLHQVLLAELMKALTAHAADHEPAWVLPSGLRVYRADKKFREPDIVYLRKACDQSKGDRYFTGADMVVEIVSDDHRSIERDYSEKTASYAAAGIPEYWIVDPQEVKFTVLTLPEGATAYAEHGVFRPGETATSKLLDGFKVDVQACFDAAKS